jgi:CHAT domain-containing protein
VGRALGATDTLLLIPDGMLHRVPFAMLRNGAAGRLLIHDHAFTVAPSASVALALLRRATRESADRPALIVAAPRGRTGAGLRPLAAVERESAEVARIYPGARLLTGLAARKAAVLEAAAGSRLVHFAAHAVADDRNPENSRLLLSGDGGNEGDLGPRDITAARFGRCEMVVLGACRTADGDAYRQEGVMSLARPFMAAGVPSVVSALWDVDDEAAGSLLPVFHAEYRRHGDAAAALRAAQLTALESRDSKLSEPSSWAVFEVLGATAPRTGAGGGRRWPPKSQ